MMAYNKCFHQEGKMSCFNSEYFTAVIKIKYILGEKATNMFILFLYNEDIFSHVKKMIMRVEEITLNVSVLIGNSMRGTGALRTVAHRSL